jgi:hypothetical protein
MASYCALGRLGWLSGFIAALIFGAGAAFAAQPKGGINNFTGDFAIGNWTLVNDPTTVGGSFSFDDTPIFAELYLTGGDSGVGGFTDFEITIPEDGTISFRWGFESVDFDCWDEGGYAVNGVYTRLACNDDGVSFFDGTATIAVAENDVFAFRVITDDGAFGPGVLGITEFDFVPAVIPPIVVSVDPDSGPESGGTAVSIEGFNFDLGATVTFGANACLNVVVVSATEITCDTPPGPPGPVDVTVTNVDTLSGTLADGFTYLADPDPPPAITSVVPNSGSESGGTAVTITGTGFQPGATVTFGTNACLNVVVVSATEITCETPPGVPGAVDVTVTNPDMQSDTLVDGFTYLADPDPPPAITSVVPNSGSESGGTAVTITGTGFQPGATVTFGTNACLNVVVVSATEITCETPPGAPGAVDVTVTNPDMQSDTLVDGFTYLADPDPPPVVTGLSPTSGPETGGTAITITGENFQPGATVTIGGNPCANVVVVNATTITCETPPGTPGPVDVTVTNPDSQSDTLAAGFTYLAGTPLPPPVAIPTMGVLGLVLMALLLLGFGLVGGRGYLRG